MCHTRFRQNGGGADTGQPERGDHDAQPVVEVELSGFRRDGRESYGNPNQTSKGNESEQRRTV